MYTKKTLRSNIYDCYTPRVLHDMYLTIMRYIKGDNDSVKIGSCGVTYITERLRQYMTWGATSFRYIVATDGCYGIEFKVTGMLHRGRVRVYYNVGSDYFDVELLRARKEEMLWGCDDLDFEQLHNVLHRHIERTDDEEV